MSIITHQPSRSIATILTLGATALVVSGFWTLHRAEETYAQAAVCGDGIVDLGEQCDDGNAISGDGCYSNCTVEDLANSHCLCAPGNPSLCVCCDPGVCICGNGLRTALEECDDGNLTDGDGCSGTCVIEQGWACTINVSAPGLSTCVNTGETCGDYVINYGEECEPTGSFPGIATNACNAQCQIEVNTTCFSGPGLSMSYCVNSLAPAMCEWSSLFYNDGI